MIISDLNYMETAESNLKGGTFASAGSTAGGAGFLVGAGTGASSSSTRIGFTFKTSSASTGGSASAVFGIVSSTSGAFSFA
jgi:hypothetical protein